MGYLIASAADLSWTVNAEKTEVTITANFDFDSRLSAGEPYAMNNSGSSPAWCGKITYAAGNTLKINGDACNYTKSSVNGIFFPEHPEYGKDVVTGTLGASLGYGCYAMGPCAYSEGYNNKSAGKYAHTEGNNTRAGWGSHAEGADNAACGVCSHSAGRYVSSYQDMTYMWSGDGAKHTISSDDRARTFNVYPQGGINGFYIGDKTLSSIIREIVDGRMPADPTARIIPCGPEILLSTAEQFIDANIEKTKTSGEETVEKTLDEIKAEADHIYAYVDKGDGTYVYRGITTTARRKPEYDPEYNEYEWRELEERQTVSYIKKQGDTDIGPLTLSGALTLASGAEFTLLCSNFKQTTTPGTVYNLSYKNSFLQAEEAHGSTIDPATGELTSYGIACTGAKGYCILSVCPAINALKLSGELSALEGNELCSYSYAAYSTAKSEFSQISAIDKDAGLVYFVKPFESSLASLSSKTEAENVSAFYSDDNALYCPRNPLIGNQVIYNFYGNHAEGGSSKAIGKYSHAEGRATVADVRYSHAEGSFTFAGGMYSHAEGNNTVAHGSCGHAEGNMTYAEGDYSHAGGNAASALADNQFVWSGGTKYGSELSSKTGTFCINPTGGLSGFYIGSKSIYQHMFDFGAATIKNDIKSSLSACFEGVTDPGDVDTASLIRALSSIYVKVK